jgi:hypothetical protein
MATVSVVRHISVLLNKTVVLLACRLDACGTFWPGYDGGFDQFSVSSGG